MARARLEVLLRKNGAMSLLPVPPTSRIVPRAGDAALHVLRQPNLRGLPTFHPQDLSCCWGTSAHLMVLPQRSRHR